MIAIAYGFQAISTQSGFLHGLKLAAVAVVAQAVWTMGVRLCPDRKRVTLAFVGASVVLGSSIASLQMVVIAVGALFGWIFLREKAGSGESIPTERGFARRLVRLVQHRPLQKGFWPMAHEIRVDYCMWLGAIFLFITGEALSR